MKIKGQTITNKNACISIDFLVNTEHFEVKYNAAIKEITKVNIKPIP
ncbi:MAG: hypothetical protein ACI9LM_002244 [Alteromonadaceae bacterium]|jgi:hypothetical protein